MKTPEEIVEALAAWSEKYATHNIYSVNQKGDPELIKIGIAAKKWVQQNKEALQEELKFSQASFNPQLNCWEFKKDKRFEFLSPVVPECGVGGVESIKFISHCEKCNEAFEVEPGLQGRKNPELCEACAAVEEKEEKQYFNNVGKNFSKKKKGEDEMPFCSSHKPILSKMGYNQAHAEAERRLKKGQKQVQCPGCLLWYFPDEL